MREQHNSSNDEFDQATVRKLDDDVTLKGLEKTENVSCYKRLNSFIATIYTDNRNIYSCDSFIIHDMIKSDEFLMEVI
ncbi:hypothetical protein SAMN05421839_13612 [Halolactibacillus halophilus]|uniref:Uncharacterized protein n=1 Tax=Halolactibacillus halophilus TaxID=306540 RepID=A0A1I5RYR8_9BACI|nr:hypothetical protein [Halolactibacillus halophilus]GEM02394.1 hypothetical protein HHA03_19260 [Halolactibacillus halophilus]SFP63567.1 hypothetical protein SAMN05421839_13612 [Halolactibacillus halophilus]